MSRIGTLLATLAERLLRPETFAQIMAPAVADAQFETRMARRLIACRHVAALLRTLALALLADLRADSALP